MAKIGAKKMSNGKGKTKLKAKYESTPRKKPVLF
jgi:hypothetical protein